jgi:hypothetical protein
MFHFLFRKGGVYIFVRNGDSWTQQGSLLVGKTNSTYSAQGRDVAISSDGNTVAAGAHLDSTHGSQNGGVYVFVRSGTTWSQQGAMLYGSTGDYDFPWQGIGVELSANGNILASSSPGPEFAANSTGAVWMFSRV